MTPSPQPDLSSLLGRPAAEFVLHREPMCLLDRLVEVSPEHATCTWRVPASGVPFAGSDGIPNYIAIECMAQCVAVHAGAIASLEGRGPPLGLLLGTRQFRALDRFLKFGVEYLVTCRELVRDGQGLASFDCTIGTRNSTFAACRLAVYERDSGMSFDDLKQ